MYEYDAMRKACDQCIVETFCCCTCARQNFGRVTRDMQLTIYGTRRATCHKTPRGYDQAHATCHKTYLDTIKRIQLTIYSLDMQRCHKTSCGHDQTPNAFSFRYLATIMPLVIRLAQQQKTERLRRHDSGVVLEREVDHHELQAPALGVPCACSACVHRFLLLFLTRRLFMPHESSLRVLRAVALHQTEKGELRARSTGQGQETNGNPDSRQSSVCVHLYGLSASFTTCRG